MLKWVNVCYVSIWEVVTKDIVKDLDVVLAAIAALEVRMLVCFLSATSSTIFLCLSVTSLYAQIC